MNADKVLFHLKYPKLYLWVSFIFIATIVFWNQGLVDFIASLGQLNYFFSFLSGMLFSLGLLSPFAAGYFITAAPSNVFVASICAGLGAMIVDLFIFRFIKSVLHVKLKVVEGHRYMKKMDRALSHRLGKLFIPYLSFSLAGILIAAPLPNNLGTILVFGITKIKERELAIMSFILYSIIALFFFSLKSIISFACGIAYCPW